MRRKIGIIGTGYVGLTTGACLAFLGHHVICADKDERKVEMLKNGKIPIYEPGIEDILDKYGDNIEYTSDVIETVKNSDVIFIAVGTPSREDGSIDMTFFKNAIKEIAESMDEYKVIVNKSTVPIGTGEWAQNEIKNYYKGDFAVVSNPEFLREGSAIKDFLEPDRMVIGAEDDKAKEIMLDIFSSIKAPKLVIDIKSAELIKYASNAFLATKISFINEISNICEKVGGDVLKVSEGVGMDKRIGDKFLNAGIGYGGSCFPKDVDGLLSISSSHNHNFSLLRAVSEANMRQQERFIERIKSILLKVKGDTVCVWGLSFKPNTDDVRKSPAIFIVNELCKEGIKVKAYDPIAIENAKKEILADNVEFFDGALDAAEGADVLALLTDWPEFNEVDLEELKRRMKNYYIMDGRNHLDGEKAKELGFNYQGIGRK